MENSDDEDDFYERVEIQELPKKKCEVNKWASIAKMDIHPAREDKKGQVVDEVFLAKQAKLTDNVVTNQPICKSSKIPKKRVLDGEHYVDDDAEKALQNKSSRSKKKCNRNGECDEDEEGKALHCRSSRIPKKRMLDTDYEEDDEVQQHKRRWNKSKYQTDSGHIYHDGAEEAAALSDEDVEKTDADLEEVMKRSKRKRVGNSTADDNKDITLTAQQRTACFRSSSNSDSISRRITSDQSEKQALMLCI